MASEYAKELAIRHGLCSMMRDRPMQNAARAIDEAIAHTRQECAKAVCLCCRQGVPLRKDGTHFADGLKVVVERLLAANEAAQEVLDGDADCVDLLMNLRSAAEAAREAKP